MESHCSFSCALLQLVYHYLRLSESYSNVIVPQDKFRKNMSWYTDGMVFPRLKCARDGSGIQVVLPDGVSENPLNLSLKPEESKIPDADEGLFLTDGLLYIPTFHGLHVNNRVVAYNAGWLVKHREWHPTAVQSFVLDIAPKGGKGVLGFHYNVYIWATYISNTIAAKVNSSYNTSKLGIDGFSSTSDKENENCDMEISGAVTFRNHNYPPGQELYFSYNIHGPVRTLVCATFQESFIGSCASLFACFCHTFTESIGVIWHSRRIYVLVQAHAKLACCCTFRPLGLINQSRRCVFLRVTCLCSFVSG